MAKLSADGLSVTVERGDTLSAIARDYGNGKTYKELAAINGIKNPNLIHIGQVIKLTSGDSPASPTESTNSNKPEITFGQLSTDEGTLYATWNWSKDKTASYKVVWTYDSGDGVWFSGNTSSITVDKDVPDLAKQSTYSIPSNAKQVRFKVKPVSETYKKNNTEVSYWEADWSDQKTWTDGTPLETPSAPSVDIVKYVLTASLNNIDIDGATHIEFQVIKNHAATAFATYKATISTGYASHAFTVDAGGEYKVRCRAYNSNAKSYSDWSSYSSETKKTMPVTPKGFSTIKAASETSVRLGWTAVATADKYDIQYTTHKESFDLDDSDVSSKSNIEGTECIISGLETGHEYFFRLRAVNDGGESAWSAIKSVVIGSEPAAPTTWSSTTTAIIGEPLNLYWVHNSEDGSSQTKAHLIITINGTTWLDTDIVNTTDEDEKDKTSVYVIDTASFNVGATLKWQVQTAGVTGTYGDWSIEREVDVYAPPTLELSVIDSDSNPIETLTSFPFYIKAIPGPAEQAPIGYYLSIVSNEVYETIDSVGKPKTVNAGDEVYGKYFDTAYTLLVEMSAGNIDLQNNIEYTVNCRVSMNSGLTAESSVTFTVTWTDLVYAPNAEIGIDYETMTASIRPYCVDGKSVCHVVNVDSGEYTLGEEFVGSAWGEVLRDCYRVSADSGVYTITEKLDTTVSGAPVPGAFVETGEQVYYGTTIDGEALYYCYVELDPPAILATGERVYYGITSDGEDIYFCFVNETVPVEDVLLSVYRREFDGSFTELATGLDSAKTTTIVDPHPALDYARYRVVATSKSTGSVSYYDLPGYPVGGTAVIIQWDEEWTNFEVSNEDEMVEPPWAGSLLKLPYNIDVADDHAPDVSLVEYIGREHPVSYYGTHVGHSSSWSVVIPKSDKETLYALRRLAKWLGDVYVREPSGSGYWANITVSFSQTHCVGTIPVKLKVTRVEGGM